MGNVTGLSDISGRIKLFFSESRYIKITVILGICGMCLILFSDFFKDEEIVENDIPESSFSTEAYTENTENKLREILQNIKGVGKAEIMVTVSCTEEYVYAEEQKSDISDGNGKNSISTENKYVFNGSDKEALLKKIISPQINGVVIACEGGEKSSVAESVYSAVSVALDIPSSRIYVTGLE